MRKFIRFMEEEYEQEILLEVLDKKVITKIIGDEYHDQISTMINSWLRGIKEYEDFVVENIYIDTILKRKNDIIKKYNKERGEIIFKDYEDDKEFYQDICKALKGEKIEDLFEDD